MGMVEIECLSAKLEFVVASVAKNRTGGVLASAKVESFGFRGFKFYRSDAAAFVAAIAKRLAGAAAAGTPEIALAGFDLNRVGTLLGNRWL